MKIKKDWRGIITASVLHVLTCAAFGVLLSVIDQHVSAAGLFTMGLFTAVNTWIKRRQWLE
jgi:hypothetical protein